MDTNKHIYKKRIGKSLTNVGGLGGMQEVVGAFTGEEIYAMFFWGRKPIEGIWATPNVLMTGACVMPAGYGVGDHKMFIVDFLTSSLVGNCPPLIFSCWHQETEHKHP
jgi:hypothetical protein